MARLLDGDLRVRDVMSRNVATIDSGQSLQAAAERMRAENVGLLVVMRVGTPVGVVTDRDITVRTTAFDRRPSSTPITDAMTPQLFHCYEDTEIEDAAHRMERLGIRRLVVLDRAGKLVGVFSVDDIAARLRDEELAGEVLEHAAEPEREPPG